MEPTLTMRPHWRCRMCTAHSRASTAGPSRRPPSSDKRLDAATTWAQCATPLTGSARLRLRKVWPSQRMIAKSLAWATLCQCLSI
eukprot:4406747-Pleurochrysis_carterae.AAC.1